MIEELLGKGKDQAITAKEITAITGYNRRLIAKIVEKERREGALICASCTGNKRGYYLAATAEELNQYCKTIHHRSSEMQKTRRLLLKAAEGMKGGAEIGKE